MNPHLIPRLMSIIAAPLGGTLIVLAAGSFLALFRRNG